MFRTPRRLAAFLLLAIALAPLGQRPAAMAAQAQPPRAAPAQDLTPLPPREEAEPNNAPTAGTPVGSASAQSWSQTVRGTIDAPGDVDYYRFVLTQPASSVRLRLGSLVADYDLLLGGGPEPGSGFDPGQPGLEDVTQVGGQISAIGGQISAIGGQISAIGGQISAIGGQISAIGGQISAIGGQISAISANSGSAPETIETFLWLPGTYYAVVASSNGASGDTSYLLTLEVSGSGLETPPVSPEVELRISAPPVPADQITTLYITNSDRMVQRYPGETGDVSSISAALNSLVTNPPSPNGAGPENGAIIFLPNLTPRDAGNLSLRQIYDKWDAEQANPLAANYVAGLIDNVIEAATTDGISGDGSQAPYYLGPSSTLPLISFPNVRNIVLVGGDDIIPGYRLPDLTTIANEADYAAYLRSIDSTGVIDPDSPQGAALRYRMITSDNPYGAGRPYRFYGFPFFVPRLAVGRLVETPAEINSYLRAYTFTPEQAYAPGFTISLDRGTPGEEQRQAFVSGYDFLQDQAKEIVGTLTETALLPSEINTLINDSWTATDLERQWGDGQFDLEFSNTRANTATNLSQLELFSVNSHFDHWQVLPASDARGNFPAQRLLSPTYFVDPGARGVPGAYFRTTLGYSVGCHSGFNVLGRAIAPGTQNAALYQADFAQAMLRHGGNWIGNTGYGYGTTDGIDYSERLATLFTEELARDVQGGSEPIYVGQSIGAALRNAKARYVRNSASLTPYDYKATHIMTLYGLPYIRALVSDRIAPPLEEERPSGSPPVEVQAPYAPSSLGRLTRTITFEIDLDDANDRAIVPRTGSTLLKLDGGDFRITDEFVQRSGGSFPTPGVRIFENNQIAAPSLPTFAYDISATSGVSDAVRLEVSDIIFLGGVYGQEGNFNPQITQVVTETDTPIINTSAEPAFTAGAGIWYPDKFFGHSSVGEGDEQRDQLVAAAAQFRADPDGTRGLLRPYSLMVFQVIYDDPGEISDAARLTRQDDQAPVIESVQIEFRGAGAAAQRAQTSQARVIVRAFDTGADPDGGQNSGIDPKDISAVYVQDSTRWVNVSFTRRADGAFTATLPVAEGAVRVIVRVTDRAGNTSYFTAKGSFQPPFDRALVRLPLLRR